MKRRPRLQAAFLETLRCYQLRPLGGDSSGQADEDPSSGPNLGGGSAGSSGGNPVGGGAGSSGARRLGGDSQGGASTNQVGGPNVGENNPSSPSGSTGNKPTASKPGLEIPSQRTRETTSFSSPARDVPLRTSPEIVRLNRSDLVRLHQDLQTILTRPEVQAQTVIVERASSSQTPLGGMGTPIAQTLSALHRSPVSLVLGIFQGLLRASGGSSGAFNTLFQSLGRAPVIVPSEGTGERANLTASLSGHLASDPAIKGTRQNFLGALQAGLGSVSLISNPTTNGVGFKGLSQILNLSPELMKIFGTSQIKNQSEAHPAPSPPYLPEGLAGILKGLTLLMEVSLVRPQQAFFSPFVRAFLGLLFLKGEVKLSPFHSPLLDELGGLMARKSRRFKRRERKRISRSDRVMAKDQSLPVDIHSQKEGQSPLHGDDDAVEERESDEMMGLLWSAA